MSVKSFTNKDGRIGYRIHVCIGKNGEGKYVYKCITTYGNVRQAQEIEKQLIVMRDQARTRKTEAEICDLRKSVITGASRMPMKKAFDRAMEKPMSRTTSELKTESKRGYWMDFLAWMEENAPLVNYMNDVTSKHAEGYISFLRKNGPYLYLKKNKERKILSNNTLNCFHKTVRSVFHLVRKDIGAVGNPFDDIPLLPEKHAGRDAYTEDQLRTIFLKADSYMQPMFFIGLFTGLSEGDICTLRKCEINFEHHHIYRKRNKTLHSSGKVSAIPMLPVLEEFLKKLVNDPGNLSEYVLPEQAADYLRDRSCVSKKVKNFLEVECGFETRQRIDGRSKLHSALDFHSLRHTFCSIAGVVGIPLTVVKSIVGHMSPRMTEHYSMHVEEKERLRWIPLFGERLRELPNLPLIESAESSGMEPERLELLAKIRSASIETVRSILAGMTA